MTAEGYVLLAARTKNPNEKYFMDSIGEKIYKLRKERGISQEELAEQVNVARYTVSRWETNNNYPTENNFKCLCDYFNVNIGYFFGVEESEAANTSPVEENVSAEATVSERNIETVAMAKPQKNLWKVLFTTVVVTALIFTVIVSAIIGFVEIAPAKGQEVVSTHEINVIGLIGLVVGVFALIILIALLCFCILSLKKRHKIAN